MHLEAQHQDPHHNCCAPPTHTRFRSDKASIVQKALTVLELLEAREMVQSLLDPFQILIAIHAPPPHSRPLLGFDMTGPSGGNQRRDPVAEHPRTPGPPLALVCVYGGSRAVQCFSQPPLPHLPHGCLQGEGPLRPRIREPAHDSHGRPPHSVPRVVDRVPISGPGRTCVPGPTFDPSSVPKRPDPERLWASGGVRTAPNKRKAGTQHTAHASPVVLQGVLQGATCGRNPLTGPIWGAHRTPCE